VRLANPLDLSTATAAYLNYMLKFSTENCQDRLQVEISTTGVSGTYTPIATEYTITENKGSLGNVPALTGSTDGWVKEVIDLSAYSGNNNIGLRFRFRSNASNTAGYARDGFQIDNLKVVKSNAVILPINFEDISALRIGDAVQIKWKAIVDASFQHYNIQRSINGVDFETIGLLTDAALFSFTDNDPKTGRNYYRVQAVENNNTSKFSKTVWIIFSSRTKINIYPNPTIDVLNIELFSNNDSEGLVELTSMEGKLVYKSKIILKRGMNLHKVNTADLPNHLYVVKIKNENGDVLRTMKIIKNNRYE
jgi:hypothetical protein